MKSSLKRFSVFLTLVLGLTAATPALHAAAAAAKGAKADKGDRAGQRVEKMTQGRDKELIDKLGLTSEQQAKLVEIRKAGAEQLKAAAGDRAKMRDVVQAQHDEVRSILTPEQQTKFDAMPGVGRAGKGKKAK